MDTGVVGVTRDPWVVGKAGHACERQRHEEESPGKYAVTTERQALRAGVYPLDRCP